MSLFLPSIKSFKLRKSFSGLVESNPKSSSSELLGPTIEENPAWISSARFETSSKMCPSSICEEQPHTNSSNSTTRRNTESRKNQPATDSPSTWIVFWTRLHSAHPNSKSAKKESSLSNRSKRFRLCDRPTRLFGVNEHHAPCHAVRRSPFRSTPRTCLSGCCG